MSVTEEGCIGSRSGSIAGLGLDVCYPGLPPPPSICSVSADTNNVPSCHGIKTKKILYDTAEREDFDREEVPTYEEVAKLYPRPGLLRPIVLIGPPGVGRNELKRRLIATDPEKYRTPVPCNYYFFCFNRILFVFLIEI